ncbi:UBP23, partial [Symbiodinium pilosum]
MNVRGPSLTNLGASCFINAGVQALLALPTLEASSETDAEKALKAVADMAHNSSSTFTPKPLTDRFYNGRQEDCSEFLMNLLLECPGASQQFKGVEKPFLQCTCCDYQYALRPETFLSLQASLQSDSVEPLGCIQSVVDHYVNMQIVQDDIIDWTCLSEDCLNAGTATNAPRRKTCITEWPRTLLVTLKRWTNHGLLGHRVCCNRRLVVGDCCYYLKAVVTHIGATASSGHYIAYRPNDIGFDKYDDARVSQVTDYGDYIVGPSEEKVYLLMYSQVPAPASPRLPPVKRPAIDLDDSEGSDDSAPTQPWPAKPTTSITIDLSPDAEPEAATQQDSVPEDDKGKQAHETEFKSRPKLHNFYNYSEDERAFIVQTLGNSNSLSEATKIIGGKLENFTMKIKQSDYFLHRSTLQNWFKRPQFAQKALQTAPAPRPQRPYNRKPARTSSFAKLTPEQKSRLGQALVEDGDAAAVAEAVQTETKQEHPVPRRTLSRWNSSSNFKQWMATAPSWSEEYKLNFGVMILDLLFPLRAQTTTNQIAKMALLSPPPQDLPSTHFRIYPTPQGSEWHSWSAAICKNHLPLTDVLPRVEIENLAVLRIHVDYRSRRGGNAEITSKQKRSLTRCRWHPATLLDAPRGDLAARAFTWLLQNNDTYRAWVHRHAALTQENKLKEGRDLPTAELLLRSPGIEIAARPWLYPLPSMADTNIQERLLPLGWTNARSKPSIRASFMHKLLSRCVDYSKDFPLQCLLYDVCMARTISAVQAIAQQNKMSPEKVASDMDTFDEYWHQQLRKLEDICRLEFARTASMDAALPSVFFTVAPAEWRYLLHEGFFEEGSLADQQQKITLHLYHTLQTLLEFHILKNGESLQRIGIAKVRQWSLRFEFQSRGTLHLHAVLWADLLPNCSAESMTGRSGTDKKSPFVRLLEELFSSRADVQVGDGAHNLLRYVAGYVSKASDALQFSREQAHHAGTPTDTSKWRQTYRLLSKKSPMEQEMLMEFAGLPMVRHSFSGHAIYPPIPGSTARNSSQDQCLVYQYYLKEQKDGLGSTRGLSYMEWLRRYRVVDANRRTVAIRNVAGPARSCDCGVAMTFPFELLDIFIGAWAATFLKELPEYRILPDTSKDKENYAASHSNEKMRRSSFTAPEGCKRLKAVLSLDEFQLPDANPNEFHPDIGKLLSQIEQDLVLRGLGDDRIATFKARMHACTLLLLEIRNGFEDPGLWSAKKISAAPRRVWSDEQQLVLDHIKAGTAVSDAAIMEHSCRILQVGGGPGTGKTEVVIAAIRQALEDNYEAYIPPGRLRQYDLIVIDEV